MSSATGELDRYNAARSHLRRSFGRYAVATGIGLLGITYGALISISPVSLYLNLAAPIILMLLLAIWMLPEMGRAPTAAIERLFTFYMMGMFLWPNYFAIALPGLPWMTMSRIWGAPLVLLMILSCSVSAAFRAEIAAPFRTNKVMLRAMLGFVATQFVALFFSKHFGDSANRMVNYQLAWTGMFFAGAFVLSRPGRAARFAKLLALMAVIQTIVAFFEWRAGAVLWATHVPPFVALNDPTVQAILAGGARAATGVYRVQSIYTTSLNFAEFLGITTPLFLHFLLTTKRPLVRAACAAYLPYSFFIIITTDSRIGLVGFFLSCLLYFLIWAVKKRIDAPRDLVAPLLLLLYPVAAASFVGLALFWSRLNHMIFGGGAQAASNESRQIQLQTGVPKVLHWPFGYGPGMGAQTLGFADNADGKLTIDNYWLSIALEYGILGFACFMTLMLTGAFKAIQFGLKARDPELKLLLPLGALIVIFITGKSVLSQEDSHALIFMTLGGIAALTHRQAMEART